MFLDNDKNQMSATIITTINVILQVSFLMHEWHNGTHAPEHESDNLIY